MYEHSRACVKVGGSLTESFFIMLGVGQEVNLSPSLFNLFINDFPLSLRYLLVRVPQISLYIIPVYIYLIHINWWRKFIVNLKLVVDTKSAPRLEGKQK
jgi:hypothetical protein